MGMVAIPKGFPRTVLVTPLLLDLLRREGVPAKPFVTRQVRRLGSPGMAGWQSVATMPDDQPVTSLLALRLADGRLDAELAIESGTLASEGDEVIATLRYAWPEQVTFGMAERTFEELTQQVALLAGQGRAVTFAQTWDAAGITVLEFAAPAVAIELAEEP